jgi:hypothetical protein
MGNGFFSLGESKVVGVGFLGAKGQQGVLASRDALLTVIKLFNLEVFQWGTLVARPRPGMWARPIFGMRDG